MKRTKKPTFEKIEINYAPYGIKLEEHKNKLDRHYDGDIKRFRDDLQANPYHVLVDVCGMSFTYADNIIMRYHHAKPDAYCRCQYAVYAVLQKNELDGNTRMTDAKLAEGVFDIANEVMGHIVNVVKDDPLIHYEPSRHLVAFEQTYKDELLIADHLKERLTRHEPIEHDIEQYRHDGDMELTDEQMEALRMVLDNDVCMLNGPAGSAKSFTTRIILDMLDDLGKSYVCLTPTGISSKVMRGYTGRPASTIHMFLMNVWKPDYVLIDESSMVSVHLLAILLSQIGYEPKLVFIADNAQLASIQCGALVQNMIEALTLLQ